MDFSLLDASRWIGDVLWQHSGWITVALIALIVFARSGTIRYIPNNKVGIAEKLWSASGSLRQGLIALAGEAGYQPDVLRGGFHFLAPFTYRIHKADLVIVPQGAIGYVYARDGAPLEPTQTLAANRPGEDFHDVRRFLTGGGQKGMQRRILREGAHAINLAQFVILTEVRTHALDLRSDEKGMIAEMKDRIARRDGFVPVVLRDGEDALGIVTVHDGPSLPSGEIIAPEVGTSRDDPATFHNNFQDPERFLAAGGLRGRQYQVLTEGTYYINRLFATVEVVGKTVIEVGNVGVVISYTGRAGDDSSGTGFRHGELVEKGCRGVWATPLLPGKYAFNLYAGKVVQVPTTNFVLKWVSGESGGHKLDENLSEISLITKDAFEPALPLSVVVHIDYQKAPLVVQRFGDIRKLVEQTLDPMVSAYFKDVGQNKTLIELLQQRADIQAFSTEEMRRKFLLYSLELQEVLIGTPRASKDDSSIERILEQLRSRQIAAEQIATYKSQQDAAQQEKNLNEARAVAQMQTSLSESKIRIEVSQNEGAAELARASQEAKKITTLAEAGRQRMIFEGEGEASRVRMVGEAQANATEKQVGAYGGPQYRLAEIVLARFAEAAEKGHLALVPQVQVAGGGEAGGNGLVNGLLGLMLAKDGLLSANRQ
ncbi:MAG TPA: SPFH domain-containing protein [Stellaceae bacterium]|nr:SPFH domain-containing protein [Stellaceae bacterium]